MFSASQFPPFEKNEANLEKLYQLMLSSKNADSDLDEVEKYLKYKTQYYEHEGSKKERNKSFIFLLLFISFFNFVGTKVSRNNLILIFEK